MIEERFVEFAALVALGVEAAAVLLLAVAALAATLRLLRLTFAGEDALSLRKAVWLKFAVGIALALEFALAADIIRTTIAPSWDAIGKLGAIAAIRTVLNLFLARDIENLAKQVEEKARATMALTPSPPWPGA
jgi:uncharacterized membrane protein